MRALSWWVVTWFALGWTFAADMPTTTIKLFDGESAFGWKTEGRVQVESGQLMLQAAPAQAASVVLTNPLPANGGTYLLELGEAGSAEGKLLLSDLSDNRLMDFDVPLKPNAVIQLDSQTDAEHWNLIVKVGGETESHGFPISKPLRSVGVKLIGQSGSIVVKSFTFTPSGGKSLFNGKDLTGWTAYTGDPKRELSKFRVTPAGELQITNGPGDLRTEATFSDFLVQFQCKTNGPNLNSGLFFRCIANQYQNGYEAQIQNGYKDNDRTKPSDFGTGAIYRRVPTRKVVSNDNEWFTMTVQAVGPRIRTWVDGYPTVDWVDDRPADENPRKGLRTAAGHLSLQGHDPTTDLLFRNILVYDLSK